MKNYTDRLQREAEDGIGGNYGHRVIKTVKTGKQSPSDIGNTFVGGPLSKNIPEGDNFGKPLVDFLLTKYGLQITEQEAEKVINHTASVENICEEGEDIRKEIQIELPKGFYNVTITVENNLVADTNNSINWDTLKIPLPSGLWIIKNIIGKTVSLSTFPSTAENKECKHEHYHYYQDSADGALYECNDCKKILHTKELPLFKPQAVPGCACEACRKILLEEKDNTVTEGKEDVDMWDEAIKLVGFLFTNDTYHRLNSKFKITRR